MSCKIDFLLLILTVTMVTKSAVAQCPEVTEEYGGLFEDCANDEFPEDYVECRLRGDPHILTFDKLKYNFGEEGYYKATYPCENGEDYDGPVIVVYMSQRAKRNDKGEKDYRIVGVKIIKNEITYKVTFKKNKIKVFTVDDDVKDLEAIPIHQDEDNDFVAFINPGNAHEIVFRCGDVKIRINCKFHSVDIWIKKDLTNVCGLCGKYNGDASDDKSCIDNCNADEDDNGDCSDNTLTCPVEEFGEIWLWEDHSSASSP